MKNQTIDRQTCVLSVCCMRRLQTSGFWSSGPSDEVTGGGAGALKQLGRWMTLRTRVWSE